VIVPIQGNNISGNKKHNKASPRLEGGEKSTRKSGHKRSKGHKAVSMGPSEGSYILKPVDNSA
jgi:hypothetical protein